MKKKENDEFQFHKIKFNLILDYLHLLQINSFASLLVIW